jgi:peptidoglycan hydrolase-like protein with peptidoglycan-binding domain
MSTPARFFTSKAPKSRIWRSRSNRQKKKSDSLQQHPLLQLQHTLGNHAIGRMIQAKLAIGKPGDKYERKADRMADQVMRLPAKVIQSKPGCPLAKGPSCGEEETIRRQTLIEEIRRADKGAGNSSEIKPATESAIRSLSGGGQPVSHVDRSFFEPRFGIDFSHVRLHTGATAGNLADTVQAKAFTVGSDIVFGRGQYAPGTTAGRHLLAHELTHTIHQMGRAPGRVGGEDQIQRPIGDGHDLKSPRFAGDPVLEAVYDDEMLLMVGARGEAVAKIQQALVDAGFPLPKFGVDGIFGAETKKVVMDFQTEAGLKVDGIVGPETLGDMDQVPTCPGGEAESTSTFAAAEAFAAPEGAADLIMAASLCYAPGGGGGGGPINPPKRCTGNKNPNTIIDSHTVTPATIKKPGDSVTIKAQFTCEVQSWDSIIEKGDGTSLGLKQPKTKTTDKFSRIWDGKKLFTEGTYLVDDGDYRHRFDNLKFACNFNPKTRKCKDVFATGPKLESPTITVKARAAASHANPQNKAENEAELARIIKSEMGVGNNTEKNALAFAVRNQMIRMNTSSVADARKKFNDAHDQPAGSDEQNIAKDVLNKPMSDDTTGGSIKWFSPKEMPKKGEESKCSAGIDCRGGLIQVNDTANNTRDVYAPSWHKTMTFVAAAGTREWLVRFYRL